MSEFSSAYLGPALGSILKSDGTQVLTAGWSAGNQAINDVASIGLNGNIVGLSNGIFSGVITQGFQYVVAAEGGSLTVSNSTSRVVLNPAGALTAFSVKLPAAPINGQTVSMTCSQAVVGLTLTANAGQSILNALTALVAGITGTWLYRSADTTWYKS